MLKYRQGDIALVSIDKLPEGLVQVPRMRGRIVVAEGEVTGHAHVLEGGAALFLATDLEDLENRFLEVAEECELVHDEHNTITVPPGIYEVKRQKEYTPEAIRVVSD